MKARAGEQQRAAQHRRAEIHAGRVERLRAALQQLPDDDLFALSSSSAPDLVTDALAPIVVARGEPKGIIAQAEHAKAMLPVVQAELKQMENDLKSVAKFQPPGGRLLLAFEGNEAVGIACLRRMSPGTAEIKRMLVRPAHRGAGLGGVLLDHLIDHLFEHDDVQRDQETVLRASGW
jgi:GNAT superfamily N-acetyltransferase